MAGTSGPLIDKVKGAIDSVKGFAGDAVDSVTSTAKEAAGSVKGFFSSAVDNVSEFLGFSDDSAMTAATVPGAALAGGTMNQDNSTEVTNHTNITINATSSEPGAIASAAGSAIENANSRNIARSTGTPFRSL